MKALAALSFILLAAHSLRIGDYGAVLCWLGLAGLLFSARNWPHLACMAGLALGLFVWADTAAQLVRFRMAFDAPWLRLALVMSSIMAVNLAALVWLARRELSRLRPGAWLQGTGFVLAFGLLWLAREMSPLQVLLLDRYALGWGMAEVFVLSLYAAWLLGKMSTPAGALRWRPRLWALFTVVFFGQLLLGLAGMENMLMTGNLHLPVPALIVAGPVFRGSGFFMPILFTVTVLLVGPAWCSHLCYVGSWDDMCSRLHKGKPKPLPRWSRWSRPGFLILAAALALFLRGAGVPGEQAVLAAALFGLMGVGIMVFLSRINGHMVHCSAWCPMGFVSTMLGRLTPWRVWLGSQCTGCGRCSRVCRYAALPPEAIESGRPTARCTLCGDCIAACPQHTAGYSFPGLRQETARALFLVLVISLHAVFLGVARI